MDFDTFQLNSILHHNQPLSSWKQTTIADLFVYGSPSISASTDGLASMRAKVITLLQHAFGVLASSTGWSLQLQLLHPILQLTLASRII